MSLIKNKLNPSLKGQDIDNSTYHLKLYGKEDCHYSHGIRLALEIKNLTIITNFVENIRDLPQEVTELSSINDMNSLPIMLERDFVINQPDIIIQYIDERFPTPPLMPIAPHDRVRMRTIVHHLENSIISLVDVALDEKNKRKTSIVRDLHDALVGFSYEYLGNLNVKEDHMNLIDCMLAPILWRLETLGVKIENRKATKYQPLIAYMNYLFSQESFINSCTEKELQLRTAS